jgi:hypothetical protein
MVQGIPFKQTLYDSSHFVNRNTIGTKDSAFRHIQME